MSYKNLHMTEKVSGIRGSVEILNPFEALAGTTWKNFHHKHVGLQEYGWTKYNDLVIVSYYFKNKFNMSKAAGEIGYAKMYIGCGKYVNNSSSISFRISRVNSIDILDIARAMIAHRLMTMADIISIITDPIDTKKPARGMKQVWASRTYIIHAAMIVEAAIKKWGTKKLAANKFKTTVKVLNFWIKANKNI